jgi:hypothetical protein
LIIFILNEPFFFIFILKPTKKKGFLGSKKHLIQGSIFGPDKKSLYSIDGEWNGVMYIKSGKKSETFINTQMLPKIKKQVRPIGEQTSMESRKYIFSFFGL